MRGSAYDLAGTAADADALVDLAAEQEPDLVLTEKAVVVHTSGIYDTLGLPADGDEHRRVLAVIHYLGR
jgi:hypothetical protein